MKPRESEAVRQGRLNDEIKANVTKILLDVTDTIFGIPLSLCAPPISLLTDISVMAILDYAQSLILWGMNYGLTSN